MPLTPASRAAATMRPASASSVWSPNIIVPSQSLPTLSPLAPSGVAGWRASAIGCSGGVRVGGDEAVAQLALQDLADRAARQLGDDLEKGDALGLPDAFVGPGAQRVGVDRC